MLIVRPFFTFIILWNWLYYPSDNEKEFIESYIIALMIKDRDHSIQRFSD